MTSFRTPAQQPLIAFLAMFAACTIAPLAAAQSQQPSYAVSTVRPSDPNAGRGMSLSVNSDSITGHNITLLMLIRATYGLSDDQVSGGPDWIRSTRFDISAKADAILAATLTPDAAQTQQRQMMQQLLADRFQLRLHHQTKDIPGYQLVVAKNGPHGLQADDSKSSGFSAHDGTLKATATTLDQLASALERRVIQAPVMNATGISGKFDFNLTWDEKQSHAAAAADAAIDNGPSIFLALQQQLGLRLEPHKTPADSIVIESAQLPQEN